MTRVLDATARAVIEGYCWVAHRAVPHLPLVGHSLLISCPVAWGTSHSRAFDRWWWGDIETQQ